MAKRATVTEADMRRAIKAARECGLSVHECVMKPTEVRLVFSRVEEKATSDDTPQPKAWPG